MQSDHVITVDHPVALHALTILRDKASTRAAFRDACSQVVSCVLYRATEKLDVREKQIVTPLREMDGSELQDKIVLVAIVRAGMAMADSALKFLPMASVGYFVLQRDEETAIASLYYKKLPPLKGANVILLDPMLATGGTADYAIHEIEGQSPKTLSFCCIVAAKEGIDRLREKHSQVKIYTVAIDESLNEKKYIVPGLGDFGDRYYGTD
jgi:uracil phosphoribosyltransferase